MYTGHYYVHSNYHPHYLRGSMAVADIARQSSPRCEHKANSIGRANVCIAQYFYLFIQHLLARPKTANKHERSGDSQPRQAKREKKKDAVREGKEIGREKEREAH